VFNGLRGLLLRPKRRQRWARVAPSQIGRRLRAVSRPLRAIDDGRNGRAMAGHEVGQGSEGMIPGRKGKYCSDDQVTLRRANSTSVSGLRRPGCCMVAAGRGEGGLANPAAPLQRRLGPNSLRQYLASHGRGISRASAEIVISVWRFRTLEAEGHGRCAF